MNNKTSGLICKKLQQQSSQEGPISFSCLKSVLIWTIYHLNTHSNNTNYTPAPKIKPKSHSSSHFQVDVRRSHMSRKQLVQHAGGDWCVFIVFLSWMGVALQGTVSKLPESIKMNNECLLTLMVVSAYFVPALIVLAHAYQFNFAGGARRVFFWKEGLKISFIRCL